MKITWQGRIEAAAERTVHAMLRRKGRDVRVVLGGDPCFIPKTRTMVLPQWSSEHAEGKEEIWAGAMDHECAHVVFTPFEEWEPTVAAWKADHGEGEARRLARMVNAFEDCRIERLWAADWPGSARNLSVMNEHYFNKDTRQGTDPDFEIEGSDGQPRRVGMFEAVVQTFLHRFKGSMRRDEIHVDVAALIDACEDEWKRGAGAETFQDVKQAAWGVYNKILELSEDPENPAQEAAKRALSEEEDPGAGLNAGSGVVLGVGDSADGNAASAPGGDGLPGDPGDGGDDDGDNPGCRGTGSSPGDKGAIATGGAWGDVAAGGFMDAPGGPVRDPGYVVHPATLAADEWETYSVEQRRQGQVAAELLREAAGPATALVRTHVTNRLRAVTRKELQRGLEDGDEIDDDCMADLAVRTGRRDVWTVEHRRMSRSAFVALLVDVSGSMGSGKPSSGPKGPTLTSPAAYAAATASAFHDALRAARIPHAVLGHTTGSGCYSVKAGQGAYARVHTTMRMYEYVPAPGLQDDGSALPYITGHGANVDGEALLRTVEYAARKADTDRIIVLMLSDGLPSGCDDHAMDGPHLRWAVEQAARWGVEVYGLAMGVSDSQWQTYRRFYPDCARRPGRAPTGSVHVKSGDGLTAAVLLRLGELLAGSGWGGR